MGDRTDEGPLEAVDLLEQLRAQGLFTQLGPFQGECHVIGEGVQQVLVMTAQTRTPDVEEPDGTSRGGECHGLSLLVVRRDRASQGGGDSGFGRDPPQFRF